MTAPTPLAVLVPNAADLPSLTVPTRVLRRPLESTLLFALAHPRWEFVFQPRYAAYLNLIEPWWKVLRSLALKGRRFEAWAEIEQAVARATTYWNTHKHPFVWGRRRRHRTPRRLGFAAPPNVALF
ncbi:hypothetical protein [Siccirubricoccus sp. G192]|uniref:hypothetical protein n=1 Tax=Siccirubricoccus sp. G192 TaxID=2849651 RepID=UPI001C2BDB21|nr:hypothetical protein [Siccirubricoccus sp. G192]MBV1796521.1 hypothetical protein [Siccirubricoccus sp. G192]